MKLPNHDLDYRELMDMTKAELSDLVMAFQEKNSELNSELCEIRGCLYSCAEELLQKAGMRDMLR